MSLTVVQYNTERFRRLETEARGFVSTRKRPTR